MTTPRVVAFDPGLTTGWSTPEDAGSWPLGDLWHESETKFFWRVFNEARRARFSADVVAIDAAFIPIRRTGFNPVNFHLHGVLSLMAAEMDAEVRVMQRANAQLAVFGTKDLTDAMVRERLRALGHTITDEHAADAVVLRLAVETVLKHGTQT